ncbi:MAG TPA: SDR family oxidoreductase [Polyangiaceae bacterium]|nr:SDR family oxidoreductase [Polyangiaceae bacterium]
MPPTVLITGANRGLGLCLVESFVGAGYRVFAGSRKTSPQLEELGRRHAELTLLTLDVTSPASVAACCNELGKVVGWLDMLLNNAAILPESGRGPLESMNIEVGHEVFDVNALGPLRVTQAFLPLLTRGERKLIVNMSSEAGSIGNCWRKEEILYCMSKAALNMQTAILRNHLGPAGFEVLAVHPGWLRTEMGGAAAEADPKDAADSIVSLLERRRMPDEPFYIDHRGEALRW